MPDAPLNRGLDPASIQRERKAAAESKPYRQHPTVTTWQYVRMSRAEQMQVQRECDALEKARRAAREQ